MGKIPLGYRFDPSVEETFRYLRHKVHNVQEPNVEFELIKEIDLYQSCPSDHLDLSKEECTYFFTRRVAVSQQSRKIDRKTKDGKGTWHMSGSDEFEMGTRNHLVYCLKGENLRGPKTDWLMHEYVLKPADAKATMNKTMALCRIYHRNQKERKGTDVCDVRERDPDASKDGSKEKLMMIESSQDYQQKKNIVAPENKEFVCMNLFSDGDESSQGHDQLKNRTPAKDGRGRGRKQREFDYDD